jgi:hypothetical protein
VFDFELHARFMRSATDAFFEFNRASLAATEAWQRQLSQPAPRASFQSLGAGPRTFDPPAFTFAASNLQSFIQPYMAPAIGGTPFNMPATPADVLDFWTKAWGLWFDAVAAMAPPQNFFKATSATTPGTTFGWPNAIMPWSFLQGPMAGWMMMAGMPPSVAGPAARGSASAMDAAEAARQHLALIFSSFQTAGGHGSAHWAPSRKN